MILAKLGVALIAIWFLTAAVLVGKGIGRRGEALNRQGSLRRRFFLALEVFPFALLSLAGLVLNAVVLVGSIGWYRVRGKALPPPPALFGRRK